MGRIGVFGGSFDPVHNGHLLVAIEARERARLDRLIVVPAARSPHKDRPAATAAARLMLLRLAFEGLPWATISELELQRGGASFTADTLAALSADHPGDELFFLLGADSLAGLASWREPERLATLATFLLVGRPGSDTTPFQSWPGLRVERVETTPVGISSTEVRERAVAGRELRGFVPDPVARAIRDGRLYGPEKTG